MGVSRKAPHSLNSASEPCQRTHTEGFYQVKNCSLEMATLNRELIGAHQIVLICLQARIFMSFVTRAMPSAKAVAPMS
jgi:hypothetical protein